MIYVDDRIGSKELFPLFPKGSAELTHLEYADFMFTGHYDAGDIVIGIERKRIGDFVNSMCSGRLSGHQLIGLLNSYHLVYLIIEGRFRANPKTGVLEVGTWGGWKEYGVGRRRFMARDIWAFENTLRIACGLHCDHCATKSDTVHYIRALKYWWTKEYDEHKGHLQPNTGTMVNLSKQSLVRKVAYQIDGVGWGGKSKVIDQHFNSVTELANTTLEELMEIEGIGKKLAGSIVKQLHGGE